MVHDYNVDTSLAGKRPEDYPLLHSLNVDNELDKPEILSSLIITSKYFQKNNIYQYATSAYHDFF
jgi:hypothetical protein